MTNGNSAERERFEAWAIKEELAYRRDNGLWFYPDFSRVDMWAAWQGAMSVCADGGKGNDAIECAIQALRQVEAGDGVFVGQCSDALEKLESMKRDAGGKDADEYREGAEHSRVLADLSAGEFKPLFPALRAECAPRADLAMSIAVDQASILEKWAKEWEKNQFQRAHDARIIAANLIKLAAPIPATDAECVPLPKQEPLGEPFQTVLNENRWDLYGNSKSGVEPECAPRALTDGWKFESNESDGRIWLTIHHPGGAKASLSARATYDEGRHSTICAQVIRDLVAIPQAECAPRAAVSDWQEAAETLERANAELSCAYVELKKKLRADAEKDAARLDFLIQNAAAVESICGRYRVARDYTLFCNWRDSAREAIDAAILASNAEPRPTVGEIRAYIAKREPK